jgi:thiol:disulfide interchange protein DsbD
MQHPDELPESISVERHHARRFAGWLSKSGLVGQPMRRPLSWRALLAAIALFGCALAASAETPFLDPSEAFRFSARLVSDNTVEVHYHIADGYYLYRERFRFVAEPGSVTLGEPVFPKGEIKFDETFNKNVEHYRHDVTVRIPVQGHGALALVSTAQGCADAGLCYPPQESRAQFSIGAAQAPASGPAGAMPLPGGALEEAGESKPGFTSVQAALQSGNLLWIAALFVGLGLTLAFTPCVLPMLPILSSIIAGSADDTPASETSGPRLVLDRARGLVLALAYAMGMALVYTALGVAAGLAGQGLAASLQTPVVLWAFAAVLVLLSLSMFGFYHLQMPAPIQHRLSMWCGRAEGGRIVGVFFMGALSALIVGPCVAAPLAATLLYISQTRNGWIGGTALFSMAVGMSVPLLILGVSEGALLPKAGPWMEAVKKFFGALLIAVAIWMVSPVVPTWAQMLAWGTLFVVSSVYLHVFDTLPVTASGWARLWKGVGVMLLLGGAAQIVGVATGGRDVLQPLAQLAGRTPVGAVDPAAALTSSAAFEKVHSVRELEARLEGAKKPVILVFSAQWCVACKEMERFTFTDARVASRMNAFTLLEADVTENNAEDQALLRRFNLFGPPGILFFDAAGRPVSGATVIGYQDAETFLTSLSRAPA